MLISTLTAQSPYIKHLTVSDGLPSNSVYQVFQDSQKFIWFATDAGAARFDGTSFRYYSMKDGLNTNEIIHIEEDSKGRIWLFNFNGTFNFIYQQIVFNAFNAPWLDELSSNYNFKRLYEDENQTLYFYDNVAREIHSLSIDLQVRKYKTESLAVSRYDKTGPFEGMWSYFLQLKNGIYTIFTSNGIYTTKYLHEKPIPVDTSFHTESVFRQNDSVIIADVVHKTLKKRLLLKFNQLNVVDTIYFPYGKKDEIQTYAFIDNRMSYWISSFSSGIYCIRDTAVKLHFDIPKAQNIMQDHEGNIWFCSLSEGVYKLNPLLLDHQHISSQAFAGKGIVDFCINQDGGIWAIDGQHVFLVKDKKVLQSDFHVPNGGIDQIAELANKTLILGESNAFLRAVKKVKIRTNQIVFSGVITDTEKVKRFSVNADNDEVSTFYPYLLYRFGQNNLYEKGEKIRIGSERFYYTFYNAKNELFVNGKEIYVFRNGTLEAFEPLSHFNGKIIRQHANLGTEAEIFNVGGDSLFLFKNNHLYNLTDAFNQNIEQQIKHFTFDDPNLFIATSTKVYLCQYPINVIFGNNINIIPLDLFFNNIQQIRFIKDNLVVASEDGMSFIPSKSFTSFSPSKPDPYFKSIFINDKIITDNNAEYTLRGRNKIQFLLGNIRFSNENVIYAYKLDGIDPDWHTGSENNIVYQDLSPGKYTFKFKVKLPASEWSQELLFNVHIKPTLWQHPLFFGFLVVLTILLLFMGLLRKRYVRLKKSENEHQLLVLEQKALHSMMNPHFIFNALGSIQSYILKNNAADAGLYLSQFARLIRQNLNAIKSSMIGLDEEVDRLRNYLDLERLRLNNRFSFIIDIEESIEEDVLIPSMIVQPVVENAVWHGISTIEADGLITILFRMHDEKSLKIIIEDNGIGITNASLQSSRKDSHLRIGMDLTRKRLDLISKKMKVKTSIITKEAYPENPNPGTRVEIVVPFSFGAAEI